MIAMSYSRYGEWVIWRDSKGESHHVPRGEHKPPTRKKNQTKVTQMVRDLLHPEIRYVTAESLSIELNIKLVQVKRAIVKLQHEGILSRPVNIPPHDSFRHYWSAGVDSSWRATGYNHLHASG